MRDQVVHGYAGNRVDVALAAEHDVTKASAKPWARPTFIRKGFRMFTLVVLWVLVIAWLVANGVFVQKPVWLYRRRRAVLTWVFFGGCVGALAGLLGHGGQRFSLPASVLGAVVAGWVACRFTRWGAAAQPQPSPPMEPLEKQPAS